MHATSASYVGASCARDFHRQFYFLYVTEVRGHSKDVSCVTGFFLIMHNDKL